MMETEKRQVHNTNSPNFVKLDYTDITNILSIIEENPLDTYNEDELVTIERLKIVKKFMERKYSKYNKGN